MIESGSKITPIPSDKSFNTNLNGCRGLEARPQLKSRGIGSSSHHITGLHGLKILNRLNT